MTTKIDYVNLCLVSLRSHVESDRTDKDGKHWGTVYLDNAKLGFVTPRAWAGYLSVLQSRGVYQPIDNYAFGEVLFE